MCGMSHLSSVLQDDLPLSIALSLKKVSWSLSSLNPSWKELTDPVLCDKDLLKGEDFSAALWLS